MLACQLALAIAQEPAAEAAAGQRLAGETSPYLLLHAHNPVDWYPWGPEAFAKAKAENKPIFLSIGYSSCYWCHVMERESFTDPEIARMLNEHFVSIKVDREERPDVDQVYMAALQAFSTGGWPMSMFLLPDGRPFFGGTYFPPRDREGFTGFLTVLDGVAKAWRDERAEIERGADRPDRDRPPQARQGARRAARSRSAPRSSPRAAASSPSSSTPSTAASASTPRTPGGPSSPSPSTSSSCSTSTAATQGRSRAARRHGRGRDPRPAGDGRSSRSTTWPAGAFATSSAAAITATPPAGTGSSPTSRRCSTTTPSSPRCTCWPSS